MGRADGNTVLRGGKTQAQIRTLFALPALTLDQAFLIGHLTLSLMFLD